MFWVILLILCIFCSLSATIREGLRLRNRSKDPNAQPLTEIEKKKVANAYGWIGVCIVIVLLLIYNHTIGF